MTRERIASLPMCFQKCALLVLGFALMSGHAMSQTSGPGSWGGVISMPAIPVSAANLPDGRILTWSAYNLTTYQPYGQDMGETYTSIFNPVTEQSDLTLISNTSHDMFCPGASVLADGKVLVNGGSSAARTSVFDTQSNSWVAEDSMNIPRAYNSNTMLSDGSILTLGGSWAEEPGCRAPEQNCPDKTAEIWSPSGWTTLTGIPAGSLRTDDKDGLFRSDNHMWLFTVAGGDVLHAGPSKEMHLLDVSGNGSISSVGSRADDDDAMNGNAIMYDIGKILTVGGAPDYELDDATKSAFVIEINNGNVSSRRTEDMDFERAYHNSVVLPNGEVFVVGGQAMPVPFSDALSVYIPELWNPTTETFRQLAPMATPRNYHSVALLLDDGRVFVGGGGLCGTCSTNHADAELFSPPYLFDGNGNLAVRPIINSAPAGAAYGEQISIQTNMAIDSVVLMRTAAVTHSLNNSQRRIPLTLTANGNNSYLVQVPSDSGIVTPGNYMLFALKADGTPSESTLIKIPSAPNATCNGSTVTVNIAAGDIPTSGDDVILGTNGDDVIVAMGGDDTICGLGGADNINGGRGEDWIDGGDGDDIIQGANDNDEIYGGNGADLIYGGPANDLIYADSGDDFIWGNSGSDTIYGGTGVDNIVAGSGDDLIYTGSGGNVGTSVIVTGGAGDDEFYGGPDADELRGESDADIIRGGGGDDRLFGGAGDDAVYGQSGNDLVRGNSGADIVKGGLGNDQVDGLGGDDLLYGGDGNDVINGSTGEDTLFGETGEDTLHGGGGNDLLYGGAGTDTCNGAGGNGDAAFACESEVNVP